MGTEGEWTIHKMPGYTGFVPGTRHIYGRSFGRVPPLAHLKEKKTESSEISQDIYRPKNIWQVLLPPVKFIPGYTGHLPGKNYVFGKTFAQQAEECFVNLSKSTKRAQEQRMKQEMDLNETRNKYEIEHYRIQAPTNEDTQNMEDSHLRHSNHTSPAKPENQQLNDHHSSESEREDHNRIRSRNDFEAKEELPDRIPERNERHQRYRTQSDGLSRYNAERRNPEDIFKHLKYESPLKSKYQSSNDLRNDTSKYDQRQLNRTPYPEEAKIRDHSYDYETPDRITSRMHELANDVRSSESKYEANSVRASESKYNLSPNYRTNEAMNDQTNAYRTATNMGDRYDTYNSYSSPDGKHSLGVNSDVQNTGDVASNRDILNEERGVAETKYSSYVAEGPNQDHSRTYPASDRGGCSCCIGHGEGVSTEKSVPSHHQVTSHQLNPPESSLPSETDYTGQKTLEGGTQVSRGLSPVSMNVRYPIGSERLHQSTERIQTAHERGSAYSLKNYDRSRPEPKSVKFQDNRHNISPMDSIPKPGIYRTSYDDYNNSARYFSTALNPPISGYRGYIPRMNSTSALGIPFATHINTNVRT